MGNRQYPNLYGGREFRLKIRRFVKYCEHREKKRYLDMEREVYLSQQIRIIATLYTPYLG